MLWNRERSSSRILIRLLLVPNHCLNPRWNWLKPDYRAYLYRDIPPEPKRILTPFSTKESLLSNQNRLLCGLWNSPFLLDSPSVLMAASEMAAGYVTRKSERHGKAFKEHSSPPMVPRFLESGIFCHISWAFYVSKFPGTSSEIDDSWPFLSILIKLRFRIEKVNVIRTNPFLLPLLHHLRQQGRIQVLAYLIGSKPYLGISPENRYFVAGLEEKVVWC